MHAITLIPTEGGDTTGLLTGHFTLVRGGKTILSKEEKQSSRFKGSLAPCSEWGDGKTFYSRFIFYSTVNPKDYYKCPI